MCPLQSREAAEKWRAELPLIPQDVDIKAEDVSPTKHPFVGQTWLMPRILPCGAVNFGCMVCAGSNDSRTRASARSSASFEGSCTNVRLKLLLRHQKADWHRKNALVFLGLRHGPTGAPTHNAPEAKACEIVMNHVRSGGSANTGVQGVGRAKNIIKSA